MNWLKAAAILALALGACWELATHPVWIARIMIGGAVAVALWGIKSALDLHDWKKRERLDDSVK